MREFKELITIHYLLLREFYLNSKIYAKRTAYLVPEPGENIQLEGKEFCVNRLIWVYDEQKGTYGRVDIEIR